MQIKNTKNKLIKERKALCNEKTKEIYTIHQTRYCKLTEEIEELQEQQTNIINQIRQLSQ